MKSELKISSYMVKPVGEELFHEATTTVSVDDDAAGVYLVLAQEGGKIRVDFDEWDLLTAAVRKLQEEWENGGT